MSLVLWSGGCDSTLVLYDLAVSKGTREKPIRALTVSHNSVNARKEQAEARKKILAQFKELGLHVTSSEVEINCLGPDWVVRGGTTQAAIWLSVASTMISDKENLYTGHHDGDQVWIMYACLESALTSLGNSMNKKIEWFVPLVSETKGNIIRRLQDAGLYELCWWCENPDKGKACGGCTPCRTHATALWSMEKWSFLDPNNAKKAIKELEEVADKKKKKKKKRRQK